MAMKQHRHRTIYIITAAAMVAMIGWYALAATTVTTLSPGQSSNVTNTPAPGGFTSIATIASEQLVVLSGGMTASTAGGIQTAGSVGISGTPTALAVCGGAPCPAQNFRTASPAAEIVGDYGEQFVLSVTQPATGGTSLGFDMVITIVASTGTSIAMSYLATGVSTAGAAQTISAFLFVDMTTTTAPVITSVSVVFNQCSSATACP